MIKENKKRRREKNKDKKCFMILNKKENLIKILKIQKMKLIKKIQLSCQIMIKSLILKKIKNNKYH